MPWGVGVNPNTGKLRINGSGTMEIPASLKDEASEAVFLVHCANQLPKLVEALRQAELCLCQTRLASGIAKKKNRTEFLLGQIERIEKQIGPIVDAAEEVGGI